ncbi:MAG: hypothetical protein EOP04_29685 [Proteobacteria bacterium]|nr:MAG: hypothetical protein EOP04_29685 [Pseudomonadota bacterium]
MLKNITIAIALSLSLVSCDSDSSSSLRAEVSTCHIIPDCKQTMPTLEKAKGFSGLYKKAISSFGPASHRGRDVLVLEGQEIWIHAKFSYGLLDSDLKNEPVDIYFSQGCDSALRRVGQTLTTVDGQHETIEGVEDTGGRIFVNLAELGIKSLPLGRHRVVLVVPADNSSTELYIDVVKKDSPIAVSDVDGTLTSSELAAASQLLGISPTAHAGAADALTILHNKGYHIVYLTARAEWFSDKTRTWLSANKFPPGTVRTTQSKAGFNGAQAANYKINELSYLKDNVGLKVEYGFGNKASDIAAYAEIGVPSDNSFFFMLPEAAPTAVNVRDYRDLLDRFEQSPKICN